MYAKCALQRYNNDTVSEDKIGEKLTSSRSSFPFSCHIIILTCLLLILQFLIRADNHQRLPSMRRRFYRDSENKCPLCPVVVLVAYLLQFPTGLIHGTKFQVNINGAENILYDRLEFQLVIFNK